MAALACGVYVIAIGPVGAAVLAPSGLVGFLESHHLYAGYGSYWDANIVTLDSLGRVRVAPVIASGLGGTIEPFRWNSTNSWYKVGASFLVFDSGNWGQVNSSTALRTWGPPESEYTYHQFTILVWKRNLRATPSLAQLSLTEFNALLAAARDYIATGEPLSQLSPLTVEKAGFLSSVYGAYPRSSSDWQWTQQGGWLGEWGTGNIAVGIYLGASTWQQLEPIVNHYHKYAVLIYFPYPSALRLPAADQLEGQLLMVFKPTSVPD